MAIALVIAACASPIEQARIALDEGELDRAVVLLEGIARDHPEEPGAWLALGRARMAANRPVAAREAFERAAVLLPHESGPRILVGHTHELERRYDEAEIAYTQAVALAPTEARPERVLGVRLLRWGRAPEAVPHLARAAELDPTSAATWNALAVAQFHAGDGGAALDTFERARRERAARGLPFERDLAVGEAAILVRARRYAEALGLYDEVLSHDPRFAAAHVGRALVLHELGRCEEARVAFARYAEAAGDTLEARARVLEYERGAGLRCVERARAAPGPVGF
ncbi:MAG: tetratricopeptide repeat protein [Sandaracinaceae bacterium]|nr:tetratricopeptide repeat protein [Sandaracinaceae bacterium]